MLSTSDEENSDIVWMPHGRAFKIIAPKTLEKGVFPKYLEHCHYSKFLTQLRINGFKVFTKGIDEGCFYHEVRRVLWGVEETQWCNDYVSDSPICSLCLQCFLRGLPHLLKYMPRYVAEPRRKKPDPANEPNFYEIDKLFPLDRKAAAVAAYSTSLVQRLPSLQAQQMHLKQGDAPLNMLAEFQLMESNSLIAGRSLLLQQLDQQQHFPAVDTSILRPILPISSSARSLNYAPMPSNETLANITYQSRLPTFASIPPTSDGMLPRHHWAEPNYMSVPMRQLQAPSEDRMHELLQREADHIALSSNTCNIDPLDFRVDVARLFPAAQMGESNCFPMPVQQDNAPLQDRTAEILQLRLEDDFCRTSFCW
jgi:hypothetical protein